METQKRQLESINCILKFEAIFFWLFSILDLRYCHYILAINQLQLANIIVDPTHKPDPQKRRLDVREVKRSRPMALKGTEFFFF